MVIFFIVNARSDQKIFKQCCLLYLPIWFYKLNLQQLNKFFKQFYGKENERKKKIKN